MNYKIVQYSALTDNYNYIIRDETQGVTAVVDPSDFDGTQQVLTDKQWTLDAIFQTHHHYDHIGGTEKLKKLYNCEVYGPKDEKRIPGVTKSLRDTMTFYFGQLKIHFFSLPGHTLYHGSYWIPEANALFCGDVLFPMGCGRVFEGTHQQMLQSLKKIATLPDDTKIYCAHEYTEINGRFALSVEPHNPDLQSRFKKVLELRQKNQPTVPSTLGEEKRTNPFLRSHNKNMQTNLRAEGELATFTHLRDLKDNF